METLSVILANFCEKNIQDINVFPLQRVSFDVSVVVSLNKLLNKQSTELGRRDSDVTSL